VRIGIVNRRVHETEILRRALTPEHQVIWIATTGADAVELCAQRTPDLVLMDVLVDGMDGVEATRQIMASTPCAILIVTGGIHTGAARVFEAMGHGALDAVEMRGGLSNGAAPLLEKIGAISRLLGEAHAPQEMAAPADRASVTGQLRLVAIGASAGGPAALAVVLRGIPKDFSAAMVVVQHVDAGFAVDMADWLSRQCALPVMVAREGERPAIGCVLLAGTSDHLAMKSADRVGYTPEPRQHACRPSVDTFFQSVSRLWRGDVVGVLLTGMGDDGAMGLKALRDRGHHTIAQDQATSAVSGMPRAAAALNAAMDILPVERIASRLIEVVSLQSAYGAHARSLAYTP
jgi:two-component system response regulator WspF